MTRSVYFVAAIFLGACSTSATNAPRPPTTSTSTTTTASTSTTTTVPVPVPVTTAVPPTVVRRGAGPRPRPATAVGAGASSVEQAICAAWGDGCAKAVAVARCESNLREGARNGPHAGLFQVNVRIHARRIAAMGFSTEQMYVAGPNIAVARALFVEQGWRPWTCAR